MHLQEQQSSFAKDVAALIEYIYLSDMVVTLGEAHRPPETAALYAKKGVGIKNSLHCDRLAVDIFIWEFDPIKYRLLTFEEWKPFGIYWESLDEHNKWGGFWEKRDLVHFERKKQ